ncbi:hypothetical protein [Mesorhizobium sp. M0491]|uniref:hypothetical protein n=1 Tax=Mesorhizobium sp. M0491 TaxID=2956950 RepID=UPI0033379DA1
MARTKCKRPRSVAEEVRYILRSLRFSPDGKHRFAEQIMAHMRADNVGAVMRVLAQLCEYPDVEEEFAWQLLAYPEQALIELKTLPEVKQVRTTFTFFRASGVEPPADLLERARKAAAKAEQILRQRGFGHLLEEVH